LERAAIGEAAMNLAAILYGIAMLVNAIVPLHVILIVYKLPSREGNEHT